MSKIYFNLVEDTEGLFESSKVIIFSSGKDYVSNGYSKADIDMISFELNEEMENIYSYDESTITESQLLFELKSKGFEKSDLLQLFEEEQDYVEEPSFKEVVTTTEKTCTCPHCGKVYTQKELRDLEFLGDCYSCDDCNGEIPEKTVLDSLELADDELRCPDCGLIENIGEFTKNSDNEYECPRCEGIVTVSASTVSTTVEEEKLEDDEDSATTTSSSTTATSGTPTSTSATTTTPTTPVVTVEIKSWNDLVGNVKLAYSFLKNYLKIGSKGMNEPMIGARDTIKNSELLNVLEENGIITNEYRTELVSKYYLEDAIINSKKSGSIDGVPSFVVLAMGCTQEVANNLSTVYSTDVDKFNELYIYWHALMMAKELKLCKPIFKNAMNSIDKQLKTTKPLFTFEELEIPDETKDFVVKYNLGEASTESSETGILEDESGAYSWDIVNVLNGIIKTKYIRIVDDSTGAEIASTIIVRALAVRGVDVSTAPYFKVPAYVTEDDISLLLSGIPGLKKSMNTVTEIAETECSCGSSCSCGGHCNSEEDDDDEDSWAEECEFEDEESYDVEES